MLGCRWMGLLVVTLGLVAGTPPALAQTLDAVVYDNGIAPQNVELTVASDTRVSARLADSFHLATDTRITGLR